MTNMSVAQCQTLSSALGEKVSFPESQQFNSSLSSYWSAQEAQLSPSCVISPTNKEDVAQTIKLLSSMNSSSNESIKLAVRGGGHTPFASSANIHDGITIDLRKLSNVEVSNDHTLVTIGGGSIWGDVYKKLDAMNLTVVGGRVSNVGVGGLTLGGGLSFFSPKKGFVCDNVQDFELVDARGEILHTSKEEPNLRKALRGGSSNFGIVTQFTMRTIPKSQIWGGIIRYNFSTLREQQKVLFDFAGSPNYDESASLIQNYAFVGAKKMFLTINSLEYTEPIENPPVFQPFTSIQPQFTNSMRITHLLDLTNEQAALAPVGQRQIFLTTTIKNNLELIRNVTKFWETSTAAISNVTGIMYALTFHPLPPAITSKSASIGGNSLGLDPSEGPLLITLLTLTWVNSSDDAIVQQTGNGLVSQIEAEAKSRKLWNKFVYLNYAHSSQNPLAGYGNESRNLLEAVRRKYDPEGFFQKVMPGGFKLF